MALTHLWYALADQSSPAGFQANSMDKCTRRSDDGPEQCLQVISYADFLLLPQSLNYLYLNNSIILSRISNYQFSIFR